MFDFGNCRKMNRNLMCTEFKTRSLCSPSSNHPACTVTICLTIYFLCTKILSNGKSQGNIMLERWRSLHFKNSNWGPVIVHCELFWKKCCLFVCFFIKLLVTSHHIFLSHIKGHRVLAVIASLFPPCYHVHYYRSLALFLSAHETELWVTAQSRQLLFNSSSQHVKRWDASYTA